MENSDLLLRAVARGIITQDQAVALDRLNAERPEVADLPRDDERLRFVSGFADIFVTIGLLLFLGTAAFFGIDQLRPAGGYALVAALAWGLAEFFTRHRRMALPSIVLLAIFAVSTFSAAGFGLTALTGGPDLGAMPSDVLLALDTAPLAVAGASLATLLLVVGHYYRFAVPITVAAGAAALVGLVVALATAFAPGIALAYANLLLLGAGLCVFALAMRFDMSDPQRVTRRTDIAFWLHLLAAPLIVHPILGTVALTDGASGADAILVLGIVVLLTAVALATDRRAILVSGLTYAGFAFGALIRKAGFSGGILPASLLVLGAFILVLSAGWHPLRKRVLRALPRPWAARLPHPLGA
ncbi:hypothetical protein G3T14_17370 [Methylobacterium sp. BTF04]|nr:hypothetical protein [Methylobacterium sp. BTF04]